MCALCGGLAPHVMNKGFEILLYSSGMESWFDERTRNLQF